VSDDEQAKVPAGPLKLVGGGQVTTEALFDEAVRTHSRRLLAIARGILGNRASPEDVVQQALLNLYQHRARYDWHEAGGLMRRAVVNEALRILRSPRMTAVSDDLPSSRAQTAAEGIVERETVQQVREAINRLPEHFRSALVLCEYEKMSYQDIANTLEVSVPQVKTWIHRGRRQLAEMLKGYIGAQPKGSRPRVHKTEAHPT
jgi:RNA polymerase sigma-70 factor, ECF subfamily